MAWQSSSINPTVTSPAADITKITNDLQVLRSVLGGGSDTDVPVGPAFGGALHLSGGNAGVGGTPLTLFHVRTTGAAEARISSFTSGNPLLTLNAEGVNGGTLEYRRASQLFALANGGTDQVVMGTGANGVYFPGISTTASAANAFLAAGSSPANQLLRSTSSRRYKQDIRDLPTARSGAVFDLRPVVYKSKADADDKGLDWYGLIAEEVAQVDPRLCHYIELDGQQVPDGVQYDRIAVLLLAEVKALRARVDALEAEVRR